MQAKTKNDHSAAQEWELAGIGTRVFAFMLDGIILAILMMLIVAIVSGLRLSSMPALNFFSMAVPVAYYWYFWTQRDGQTPGKFALGIRVVKAQGGAISNTDAVIRAIGYHVSAILCGLGYIWAIFDKNNQAWHDKLAKTYVVRSEERRKIVEV